MFVFVIKVFRNLVFFGRLYVVYGYFGSTSKCDRGLIGRKVENIDYLVFRRKGWLFFI